MVKMHIRLSMDWIKEGEQIMLIKIEAIVREEKLEDVKEALNAIQVNGITVSQVMGCGSQRGYKSVVRGMEKYSARKFEVR